MRNEWVKINSPYSYLLIWWGEMELSYWLIPLLRNQVIIFTGSYKYLPPPILADCSGEK